MFALIPDVGGNRGDIGFAHGKGGVPVLPTESLGLRKRLLNPSRSTSLDKLGDLRRRNDCWSAYQAMDVVGHTPYLDRHHLILLGDASKVRPNSFLDFMSDPSETIFRTEHDVVVQRGVGVGHDFNRRYATTQGLSGR